MNETELRQIVRAAIQRHVAVPGAADAVPDPLVVSGTPSDVPQRVAFGDHASHAMYLQLTNAGGSCVIEAHVSCDHCGYCKSHGH